MMPDTLTKAQQLAFQIDTDPITSSYVKTFMSEDRLRECLNLKSEAQILADYVVKEEEIPVTRKYPPFDMLVGRSENWNFDDYVYCVVMGALIVATATMLILLAIDLACS